MIRIAVTMGDAGGVGPWVVVRALERLQRIRARVLVIGDGFVLQEAAKRLGVAIPKNVEIRDLKNIPRRSFKPGRLSGIYGKAALEYIEAAVRLAAAKEVDAIVTAPVSKEAIAKSGIAFKGHTEYLAERTSSKNAGMLFVADKLKVALVTRHIPLLKVSSCITSKNIHNLARLVDAALKKYFKIAKPRLGVCALNPHCGENGIFGKEEKRIIVPAVKRARAQGIEAFGPFSGDAVFYKALKGEYDAVIAMYHDQALAPFKMLYALEGVNVTLGLPFIRTSADHGTAFDIAGSMREDPTSMINAIKLAVRMASC